MFVDQLTNAVGEARSDAALVALNQTIWQGLAAGALNDDDAQRLADSIHARRMALRGPVGSQGAALKPTPARSYFPPKRPLQRSPDRQKSLERRRTLAASGVMPPQLAARFTTGELAVLRVVADEVRDRGSCTLTVPEIAARAGVGQTKARMAIKEASLLGLLTVTERRVPYQKNLPNVVRVISREWLAWIKRGTRKETGSRSGGGSTYPRATNTNLSSRQAERAGMEKRNLTGWRSGGSR